MFSDFHAKHARTTKLQGPDADVVVVYAKTEPDKGSKGISAFLVETAASSGFSCARKLDKLGMRGSNTGELIFDDVFVPRENLLGAENHGVKVLMEGLDIERLVLSAGPVGYVFLLLPRTFFSSILTPHLHRIMQSALDLVLPYTHTRQQFDRPIAHNQLIQGKLADMYTALQASRSYTYTTAKRFDEDGILKTIDCAGAVCLSLPFPFPFPPLKKILTLRNSKIKRFSSPPNAPPKSAPSPSNSSAATATSTISPPAVSGATPSYTRSAPARARFVGWSSGGRLIASLGDVRSTVLCTYVRVGGKIFFLAFLVFGEVFSFFFFAG